jgi:hypothetical protein
VKNKRVLCKAWLGMGLMLALVLAVCSVLPALAQTGPETMNFQGHLLDGSGNPRSGETHCMRFRLCTNASSQSACTASKVWPVSADYEFHEVTTESGTYKAGLFTVVLGSVHPIPPQLMFDHDTLYVGIGVADEPAGCDDPAMTYTVMDPPGQLRSSAYAQRSRRVNTEESDDAYLISVGNTGQGGGVYARTDSTTDGARAGFFYAYATSGQTYGIYGRTDSASNGASAVYGEASQASGQVHGLYGKTNSAGGYGVYGTGPQVGVRGVGNTAGSVTPGVDVGVLGDSAGGDGVWGVTDSSADQSAGVRGWANATSGLTSGVYGYNRSSSDGAQGVYGYATAANGITYGVYGEAASLSGRGVYGKGGYHGVYGEGSDPTGVTYGVFGISTGTNGYGVRGQSTYKDGVSGRTDSTAAFGVYGSGPHVGIKGVGNQYSSVSATNNVGVWGDSATGDGVWGTTEYTVDNSSGVMGWAKGATGQTAGVWGYNSSSTDGARGVYGYAVANSGQTYGVYGETESVSPGASGVYGHAGDMDGRVYGVYGESASRSDQSAGVYGHAGQYGGQVYGVYGQCDSITDGAAAGYFRATATSGTAQGLDVGIASTSDSATAGSFAATGTSGQTTGLFVINHSTSDYATGGAFDMIGGSGNTEALKATNNSSTDGAKAGFFLAGATSGQTVGVYGFNMSTTSGARAVFGYAQGATGATYGVYGETLSSTDGATGVYGLSYEGSTNGVWGETQSVDSSSAAVYGYASAAEGSGVALVGRSAGTGDILRGYGASYPDVEFRVENDGDVYADGSFHGGGADFAEMLPAVEGLEAGDVLAIGQDGSLVRSSQAYQSTVVGVHSTQPGFLGGAGDDPSINSGQALMGKVPLAVVGVVPVKVSAENGPIRPGDLLVASATPGYAMRAGENPPLGTVIGKALAGWESGVGVIQMLVTLQ